MELQSHHPRLRREAQHVLTVLCWVRDRHDARAAGAGALVQGCKDAHKGMTAAALAAAWSRPFDSDVAAFLRFRKFKPPTLANPDNTHMSPTVSDCSWLWL